MCYDLSWMEDTPEEVMTKSCLKIGKGSDGRYPKEIVGTFKNGLMSKFLLDAKLKFKQVKFLILPG